MIIPPRKLGRRNPLRLPAIELSDILTGVPVHPLAADHLALVKDWILGANDKYGVCGPVAMANQRKLITTALADTPQTVSQDDIFDLYRRSGNPGFNPDNGDDDNGVVLQLMFKAALDGGFAGVKPLAFARVDTSNLDLVRAAVAIFGSTLWGVTLQKAQQDQKGIWTYAPSGNWGGHAVLDGRYVHPEDPICVDGSVVSWAEVFDVTLEFEERQTDEAWVVIWPENLGTRQFQEGIDQDALKAAYLTLTGRTLTL